MKEGEFFSDDKKLQDYANFVSLHSLTEQKLFKFFQIYIYYIYLSIFGPTDLMESHQGWIS